MSTDADCMQYQSYQVQSECTYREYNNETIVVNSLEVLWPEKSGADATCPSFVPSSQYKSGDGVTSLQSCATFQNLTTFCIGYGECLTEEGRVYQILPFFELVYHYCHDQERGCSSSLRKWSAYRGDNDCAYISYGEEWKLEEPLYSPSSRKYRYCAPTGPGLRRDRTSW